MVGNIAMIFLILNLLIAAALMLGVWLYLDWREQTEEERNAKYVLRSLRRGVSRVFGDKECIICTEEFLENDQVV